MFKKILVANRGEIARRVIRACKAVGAQPIAVYSEADADSSYLKEAHEAVCIGPAQASLSYLSQEAILDAAAKTDCQAIHPGYGFLSENAIFASRCELQKLSFIGPKPSHIHAMGDKATARSIMANANVLGIPGSEGILSSVEEALEVASRLKYPVLLKATAGGGGKGMRVVQSPSEMKEKFSEASNEAQKAFGNGGLYLEKYLTNARHIEFQVMGDSYGNVVHFGERECSIQRRSQKLLEEAPSVFINPEIRDRVGIEVCAALRKIGYQNAGTVEFLFDENCNHYFIEMNTRIQVEHGITELISGIDLVAMQIRLAAGERLKIRQEDVVQRGHAIECRINAEDPNNDFRPTPGNITSVAFPPHDIAGPVRIDTHVETGSKISPYYDSMLAKVMTWGESRNEAIAAMRQALSSTKIEGVSTTIGFHQGILENQAFVSGKYHCGTLGS